MPVVSCLGILDFCDSKLQSNESRDISTSKFWYYVPGFTESLIVRYIASAINSIKKCKPHSNSKFHPRGKVTLGKVHMHRIIFQHVFDTRDTLRSGKLTISEGDKHGARFSQ